MVKARKINKPVSKKSSGTSTKGKKVEEVATCGGCSRVVTDDTRAVQCERCLDCDAWRCMDCFKMSVEVYDSLASEAGNGFHWYCEGCNKVMTSELGCSATMGDCGQKLDQMVQFLEKLLERTISMEQKLGEKADRKEVEALQVRVSKIEEGASPAADVSSATTTKVVEQVLLKQREDDTDLNSRKCNIILYRVDEDAKDSVDERKQKDTLFIKELCKDALKITVEEKDIAKMYRLGKKSEDGRSRPLLLGLKTETKKEEIMENLGRLKTADARFQQIGLGHDLPPKQREQIRKMLTEARSKDAGALSNGANSGNMKYRVVGMGSKMRVIKITKDH